MSTVPVPGRILTGDTPTGQTARFSFRAPSDFWITVVINGIFNTLVNPDAWTQGGTATAQDAADIFSEIVFTITMQTDVGQILYFATPFLPSYCLSCNGASLLRTDYPELFTAIGTLWGSVDGSHFNVPDFRDKTLIDEGLTFAITDTGGEQNHTLTIAEMPTHNHAIGDTLLTGTSVPPPLDASFVGPHIFDTTANEGGGGSHNNMQPYTAVNFGIVFTDEH